MRRILIALTLVGMLVGCGDGKTVTAVSICPTNLVFAVAVDVRDAHTGHAAGLGGVLYGTHQIGPTTYTDSGKTVTADGLTIYTGAFAGTYNLRLQVPGYAAWTDNGVVVPAANTDGACGTPQPVHLQATIQPAS